MNTRWIRLTVLTATIGVLGLAPAAQGEVRVSPNYKLESDSSPFRGRDQIAFAANPANPQHVVAIYANYLDSTCDASASFDGGATWSAAVPLTPPAPTGGAQPFVKSCSNTVGTSQYVEFGTGQNVYTVATAQRQGPGFLQDPSALLYKSTDGGLTWQPGVVAMQGGPGSIDFSSGPAWYRPSLGVHRGGGTGGADRIHLVARAIQGCGTNCFPIRSVVSNDGGQTFSNPVDVTSEVANQDFPSKPIVNSDGSVTVGWRTLGTEGLIKAARSTNGGQSWGTPVNVARVTNTGTLTTTHVQTSPPSGQSTSASYPRMAGGPNGRIYLVYSQGSTGPTPPSGGFRGADHFISPDSQVWFQRSLDNGATWSAPKRLSEQLNSLPGVRVHQTRHPTISVSPNGRINVVWHDRRHWYQGPGERTCTHSHIFCEDIRLGDTYYSYSTDGGDTFSTPLRITDRSQNNEVGYDTRPSGYWWFGPQSVTVGADKVLIGWMDSREGNWDTDNEDIYLAKVDFDASGPVPQTNIDEPNAASRSVALSKLGYQGGTEGALIGGPRDPAGAGPTGPASRNTSAVVIVNENDVAGALAGAVLGRANPGPVLLSPASGLPASVKEEVQRMSPAGAYVIGDTGSLSAQVVTDLQSVGVPAGQITRLSGANNAATAAAIAARMDYRTQAEKDPGVPAFDAAVIANPATPDAAAAAGLAAARRLPVLYVGSDSIPSETQAALTSLKIDRTLVIGGPSSVSGAVLGQLPSAKRLGGANQYDTSKAVVAESKDRGLPSNVVYVADGSQPMDGALLGGVVARATGMLVLAPAPLRTTAPGQASDFGLGGISRFFILGPGAAPAAGPGAGPGTGVPGQPRATKARPRLSLKVRRRLRRGTITLVLSGRVRAPRTGAGAGTSASRRCAGTVAVAVRGARNRGIVGTRTRVRRNCSFRKVVRFTRAGMSRRLGRRLARRTRRVRVVARYGGNSFLAPASRAVRVRIGR